MRSSALVIAFLALTLAVGAGAARGDDDPHEKMIRSTGACIECHTRVPKPDEHAADYFLVDPPSETCLGCHSESEHTGVLEHVGKDLPEGVALPADENGKIACMTCHDPHPQGVLPGRTVHKSEASAGTRAFIATRSWPASVERRDPSEAFGGLLRAPMGQRECSICHASVRERPWRETTTWSEAVRVLPR
jgi:hypothetical protein